MSVLHEGIQSASGDLIRYIVEKRILFSQLSLEEKLLVKNGKPTPPLLLSQTCKKHVRTFQTKWYSTYLWLTGSTQINRMFCFPCLLFFPNMKNKWVHPGLGAESLQNFSLEVKRHVVLTEHIAATVSLNELGKIRIDHALSTQMREEAIKHNEKVKKNRAIVERLVQSTCFLGKQELAFRGHDETKASDNRGNYLELLDFLASNESIMKEHLESDAVFKGTSSEIQNELIESVNDVINEYIMDEIHKCRFLSIQADETTDVSNKAQLSVILRYVNIETATIEERFMGFYDVSANKTAGGISSVLLNLLQKWQIPAEKLICQTYDGASVMAGQHGGVHTLIRQQYPRARFIHCYAHQLNLVLLHSSKTIKDVKLFLANMTLFHTFFSRSSKRSQLLRERGFKLPHPCETRWNYNSRGVATIKTHYFELHAALQHISNDENNEWDPNSIALANSVLRVLSHPKFVYFLHFYDEIFYHTNIVYEILQKKNSAVTQCITEIQNCKTYLSSIRNENFVNTCVGKASEFLNRIHRVENDNEDIEMDDDNIAYYSPAVVSNLRRVSFEILDSIINQMDVRFGDFDQMEFSSLLDPTKFQNYAVDFPQQAMNVLIDNYPFFDTERLRSELKYIYQSPDKRMNPQELLKFLIHNQLSDCLPELTKLIVLILTIPSTTASSERSMSTLKRIKTYLRSTMTNFRLSNLAIIAIEKSLVKSNFSNQTFLDRVIDNFSSKKERKLDLVYRKV